MHLPGMRRSREHITRRRQVPRSVPGRQPVEPCACRSSPTNNALCLPEQSTGTRITVYSVCCPRSTDRIVQILGKPSDCVECIKQIIALVKEVRFCPVSFLGRNLISFFRQQSQIKGVVDQYNPYNYDESFASEYGGFGEGGALVGMGAGGAGGGMRTPAGPRGGPVERELKIPTLVRDVPRPLSPPRHRYRTNSYERDMPPPSLMGVGQPVRGPVYVSPSRHPSKTFPF